MRMLKLKDIGEKVALYLSGMYEFRAPPVCTHLWNDGDWIRFVDSYKGWLPAEGDTVEYDN